jgi:SAM-dependent methyltransferase
MKLTHEQIGGLGLYDFLGYIGSMNQTTFGGRQGTQKLFEQLNLIQLSKNKPISILEVGCSIGYVTCNVAQNINCDITGIDISEILIEKAKEKKRKMDLDNVHFQVADARNLPFEDNSFDIVFAQALVALLSEKNLCLKEFLRVIKPEGKIGTLDVFAKEHTSPKILNEINDSMSSVMGHDINVLTLSEWKTIFEENNLNEVKISENYDSVFKTTTPLKEVIPAMFRLLYHMTINQKIRRKLIPIFKLAKKMMNEKSELRKNLGYFIFTGEK